MITALRAVSLTSATLSSASINVTGCMNSAIQSVGNKWTKSAICLNISINKII